MAHLWKFVFFYSLAIKDTNGHELNHKSNIDELFMAHSWIFMLFYSLAIKDTNGHELNHK